MHESEFMQVIYLFINYNILRRDIEKILIRY